jgi:hypothetical protein
MYGVREAIFALKLLPFAGKRERAENLMPLLRARLNSRHAAKASGRKRRSIQGFAKLM